MPLAESMGAAADPATTDAAAPQIERIEIGSDGFNPPAYSVVVWVAEEARFKVGLSAIQNVLEEEGALPTGMSAKREFWPGPGAPLAVIGADGYGPHIPDGFRCYLSPEQARQVVAVLDERFGINWDYEPHASEPGPNRQAASKISYRFPVEIISPPVAEPGADMT